MFGLFESEKKAQEDGIELLKAAGKAAGKAISKVASKPAPKPYKSKADSVDKERKTSPTEKSIRDVFGSYGVHLTNDLIRYIRKNPSLIVKRLKELYPDKF